MVRIGGNKAHRGTFAFVGQPDVAHRGEIDLSDHNCVLARLEIERAAYGRRNVRYAGHGGNVARVGVDQARELGLGLVDRCHPAAPVHAFFKPGLRVVGNCLCDRRCHGALRAA